MIVDQILSAVSVVFFVFISIVFYVFCVSSFLPRTMIKLKFIPEEIKDRGLKKFIFDNGRSIVYEPSPEIRKYVHQYTLMEMYGTKFIKCKIAANINSINYDVIVFDCRGKMIDIVGVRENISEPGYTSTVGLPADTSYASIVLRKVDKVYTSKAKVAEYRPLSLCAFSIVTILLSVAEVYFIKELVDSFFHFFSIGFTYTELSPIFYPIFALALGGLCSLMIIASYIHKTSRIINR